MNAVASSRLLPWWVLVPCLTAFASPPPASRVTLDHRGAPLAAVLADLSSAERRLVPAPEFRLAKATVVARDAERGALEARLAEVFGGEWVEKPGKGERRLELRRRRDVETWRRTWVAAREAAEAEVLRAHTAVILGFLEKTLSTVDEGTNPDALPEGVVEQNIALLLKSLSPQERLRIAEYRAAAAPRTPADSLNAPPSPLRRSFGSLSSYQQGLLRRWFAENHGDPPRTRLTAARLAMLPDTVIEFGPNPGGSVGIRFLPPRGRSWITQGAGGTWALHLLNARCLREQLRQMALRPTPRGALLGAAPTQQGDLEPAARWREPTSKERRIDGLPGSLLTEDWLAAVASRLGVALVADHYTLSRRQALQTGAVGAQLEAGCRALELVARVEPGFLLVRHPAWPDLDEREAPAPYPSPWIAARRQGELTLEEMLELTRLTPAQLDGLADYVDPPVSFAGEVRRLRQLPWLWRLLSALSPPQREQARRAGLPLAGLDRRLRSLIVHPDGVPLPYERLRLVVVGPKPPARGRLQFVLLEEPRREPIWDSETGWRDPAEGR